MPLTEADSQAPAAKHRGWSVKMILWSAALAAFLLLAAWGAANWKVFHLAYCKHMIKHASEANRTRRLLNLVRAHFREGDPREQIIQKMCPFHLALLTDGPSSDSHDECYEFEAHADSTDRNAQVRQGLHIYFREGKYVRAGIFTTVQDSAGNRSTFETDQSIIRL